MRTALLIGGSGATGGLIARGLAERGFDLTILHRGVHEPDDIADFPHLHADPHFEEPMREALGDRAFDVVVATYGRVRTLASLFSGRCERFVAIGGIPIYAGYLDPSATRPTGMRLFAREDDPHPDTSRMQPAGAASFASKMIAAEAAVMAEHIRGGFAASIFRYPVVYGPRSIGETDWSIIKRVADGRPFILLPNEGLGIISRCAAINCAHAVLMSIDCADARGRIFNLADDDQYTLGQWTEMILDHMGSKAEIVGLPRSLTWAASHLVPLSGTTTIHAIVDASLANRVLGYRDLVSARQALPQMVDWRLENPPPTADNRSWADPFDYALEDEVRRRLDAFNVDMEPIARHAPAVHPYPHPKEPGLAPDHKGR